MVVRIKVFSLGFDIVFIESEMLVSSVFIFVLRFMFSRKILKYCLNFFIKGIYLVYCIDFGKNWNMYFSEFFIKGLSEVFFI